LNICGQFFQSLSYLLSKIQQGTILERYLRRRADIKTFNKTDVYSFTEQTSV